MSSKKKKKSGSGTGPGKVRLNQRVVLATLLTPLLLLALWFFFTSKAFETRTAAQAREVSAQAAAQAASSQLTGLATGLTPQATGLLTKGLELDQRLPQTSDAITLGTRVTETAAAVGVTLDSFDRGETYTSGEAVAQTFKVSASGDRGQLVAFINALGDQGQLLTVPEVSVSTSGGRSPSGATVTSPSGTTTAQLVLVAWSNTAEMLNPSAQTTTPAPVDVPPLDYPDVPLDGRDIQPPPP